MIKKVIFFVLFFILFTSVTFAEDIIPPPIESINIHLKIFTSSETFYDSNLPVEACNSDNNATETKLATAYCAIIQSGIENSWNWDWAPGAFLNSLGGIDGFTTEDSEGSLIYHYWSWSLNGNEGMTGLNQYELQANDEITLEFIDPIPPIIEPEKKSRSSSGSYIQDINIPLITFDIEKAFNFLISRQKEDGSFGENLYTDWVTLAFASNSNYLEQKNLLVKFFSENKFLGESLTDHERHAMALMSLGLNPYSTNGENHIQKIIDAFDGNQIGNPEEINDDIFGLIVLQNTGFTENDEIVKKTAEFIVSQQKENGSWNESVDLTGAGIASLSFTRQDEKIKNTLKKAGEFLKEKEVNGYWENISSTAWALQGKIALGEEVQQKTLEYFGENQAEDGGIKEENIQNKIWQTAYVLTSLSGKTWPKIMQKFEKPIVVPTNKVISTNPLTEKINNTYSTKFAQKIENFQKNNASELEETIIPGEETENIKPKKQNWFRKIIGLIFNF